MKRILIIVNKWWECDPVMNVLLNDNARPAAALGWPDPLNHPHRRPLGAYPGDPNPKPRAIFQLTNSTAEVWCISDLLERPEDTAEFQSSSQRKAERLPLVFQGATPDLVIAVGTAALPSVVTENGCVVVGTGVFMHDGHPGGTNPSSQWNDGPFDRLLPSALDAARFAAFMKLDGTVTDRFVTPPLNPSWKPRLLAQPGYVSLGTVNVTNNVEYAVADASTLSAFAKARVVGTPMSVETTHGLIRAQSEAPFLFVSGIVNRLGCIGDEMIPRSYAQNTVGAHNAGLAIAWMLPNINAAL